MNSENKNLDIAPIFPDQQAIMDSIKFTGAENAISFTEKFMDTVLLPFLRDDHTKGNKGAGSVLIGIAYDRDKDDNNGSFESVVTGTGPQYLMDNLREKISKTMKSPGEQLAEMLAQAISQRLKKQAGE